MNLNTVIFDMDGLLIDSEPLWNQAANEVFKQYGVSLSEEQYKTTTGLRTKEFVQWWFRQFNLGDAELANAEKKIVHLVLKKVKESGTMMPGVHHIINFFQQKGFKIGLATSSPIELIESIKNLGSKDILKGVPFKFSMLHISSIAPNSLK